MPATPIFLASDFDDAFRASETLTSRNHGSLPPNQLYMRSVSGFKWAWGIVPFTQRGGYLTVRYGSYTSASTSGYKASGHLDSATGTPIIDTPFPDYTWAGSPTHENDPNKWGALFYTEETMTLINGYPNAGPYNVTATTEQQDWGYLDTTNSDASVTRTETITLSQPIDDNAMLALAVQQAASNPLPDWIQNGEFSSPSDYYNFDEYVPPTDPDAGIDVPTTTYSGNSRFDHRVQAVGLSETPSGLIYGSVWGFSFDGSTGIQSNAGASATRCQWLVTSRVQYCLLQMDWEYAPMGSSYGVINNTVYRISGFQWADPFKEYDLAVPGGSIDLNGMVERDINIFFGDQAALDAWAASQGYTVVGPVDSAAVPIDNSSAPIDQ